MLCPSRGVVRSVRGGGGVVVLGGGGGGEPLLTPTSLVWYLFLPSNCVISSTHPLEHLSPGWCWHGGGGVGGGEVHMVSPHLCLSLPFLSWPMVTHVLLSPHARPQ